MSRTNSRAPRTKLRPPVSIASLSTSGLTSGALAGASASTMFCAMNRSLRSSAQSSSASPMTLSTVSSTAR